MNDQPTQTPGSIAHRGTHGFRLLDFDALHKRQLLSGLGVSDWDIPALVCHWEAPLACTCHNVDSDVAAPQLPDTTSGLRLFAYMFTLSGKIEGAKWTRKTI